MRRTLVSGTHPLLPKLILGMLGVVVVALVIRVQHNEAADLRRQVEQLQHRGAVASRKLHLGSAFAAPQPTSTSGGQPTTSHLATAAPIVATAPTERQGKGALRDAEVALSAEINEAAMQHLFYARGEGRTFRALYESRSRSRCSDVTCNGRGLAVRIPNVTEGCECVCSGGWTGAACHVPPAAGLPLAAHDEVPHDHVVIPLDREDVPVPPSHVSASSLASCRSAAVAYFNEHSAAGEFRSDRAVDHLWKIAKELMPPYCSTTKDRVAIVDVGAHTGTKAALWADLLLAPGREHRCSSGDVIADDSVVLLVEPNPLNLLSLRKAAHAVTSPINKSQGYHGVVIVQDVAAAHYDGEGVLSVDLAANRNKKRDGNERGFLRLGTRNTSLTVGTVREVRTTVRSVSALVREAPQLPQSTSARPITAISVLKIDAEGLDPLVLYGAHDVLHMTHVVVFECHKLWRERGKHTAPPPSHTNTADKGGSEWWRLKEVVEYLAKHGMDTFLVGQYFWIPMTPPHYWDDVYEEKMAWGNCVAVRKEHPLRKAFSLPHPCTTG